MIRKFLADCLNRGWIEGFKIEDPEHTITAPIDKVAKRLVKAASPPRGARLVAVVSAAGKVSVTEEYPPDTKGARAVAVLPKPHATERPRDPPHSVRAAEVLHEFCMPGQWTDWLTGEAVVACGNMTGERYLIMHREGLPAERVGAPLARVTDGAHLAAVRLGLPELPPEEEVLGLKLVVEHRECEIETLLANFRDQTIDVSILAGAVIGAGWAR